MNFICEQMVSQEQTGGMVREYIIKSDRLKINWYNRAGIGPGSVGHIFMADTQQLIAGVNF